jgi:starch synthase
MMSEPLKVLQVSAELYPFVKTGGLADVAAALPPALREAGADVRLLLPGLPAYRDAATGLQSVAEFELPWRERVNVLQGRLAEHSVYLVDAPGLYRREGGPYEDAQGKGFADNHRRFAALGWVAARLGTGLDAAWQPAVVHGHDWHAGLASAVLRFSRWPGKPTARSLFTIHNLAYQGLFPPSVSNELGLPASAMGLRGMEYWGQLSFMKAGLQYADALSTVSPSYAQEIQTPEQGCGLDGLLRERHDVLHGVLNGCDYSVWHPSVDAHIAHRFDADQLEGKAACKAALQQELGWRPEAKPLLLSMVSRLAEQKGVQLVIEHLPAWLAAHNAQAVVVGQGDAALESALQQLAQAQPQRFAFKRGVDEALAHRVIAGCDVLLVPSRFEPCGLTQMYAMAYGTLPLVRRTGGLGDTVADVSLENLADGIASGLVFDRYSAADFQRALRRLEVLHQQPKAWAQVQRRAMAQRFDWASAAQQYLKIYSSFNHAPS